MILCIANKNIQLKIYMNLTLDIHFEFMVILKKNNKTKQNSLLYKILIKNNIMFYLINLVKC